MILLSARKLNFRFNVMTINEVSLNRLLLHNEIELLRSHSSSVNLPLQLPPKIQPLAWYLLTLSLGGQQ